MNILEAIAERRSIRKFQDRPIPDDVLRQILHAATLAPSGKNRQPWRFHVVQGEARAEMVRVMRAGMARFDAPGENTGSAEWTVQIMEQAPVTVFVYNPFAEYKRPLKNVGDIMLNIVDVQSVGAAIQNMLLAALELGLGSLWICDVFYAYEELCEWLGETHQMIAAVSLGYADESPGPRPRQPVDEVTRWVD
ncbi:MAG TPA: nitroreductase family protein [Anaerolineae bacterium]|nr:nitroreductase family protein [Anaerolineae bacterium]